MKKLFEGFTLKKYLVDTIYDIIGSILYAAGIYTFVNNANFAPGGISGAAIIISHFINLPLGVCMLVLNIPILIICLKTLPKRFFVKSAQTIIISTIMLDVIFPMFPVYEGEPLLAAIFGGLLFGGGLALIYSRESSTGGTDFLIFSIKKRLPHLSIGTIAAITDVVIILLGGLVFKQVNAVLYGIVMTFVSNQIIDKIMYGFDSGKMTLIISDNGQKIADDINKEVSRSATMMKAVGTFSGKEKQLLLCGCTKAESMAIKRITYRNDPGATVMLVSYDEAYGNGFRNPEKD